MVILNKVRVKKMIGRLRNIINNPFDWKYLFFNRKVSKDGIIIVIHESNYLGASLLALNTAKELKKKGYNVYIITLQFGELNKEYSKIAPTQIIFSKSKFKRTLMILKKQYNFSRILMISAAVGGYTKIAAELNYFVVSEIHELPSVIDLLDLKRETKEMIRYSDKVLFSTISAKKAVLKHLGFNDENKVLVKPQGVYLNKPSESVIKIEKARIINNYPFIKGKKIIIGVGNTSFRKGFDLFSAVAQKMPKDIFLWAGKRERFFNRVKKNLPKNLIYLGQLNSNELSGVYSIADVLLLSSRKDTLPSTIFESFLYNVPVIGSEKSGGISEVIINGKNGLLTENTAVEEYISAISIVLDRKQNKNIQDYLKKNNKNNSFSNYISFIISLYK